MAAIRRLLWTWVVLAAASVAHAAPGDATALVSVAATSRLYVTLVPRSGEAEDFKARPLDLGVLSGGSLKLPLNAARRNRLEFALTHTDVVTPGDRLRLRMASDAHVIAQLLSGGQFSDADDSWIAVLGIASRVHLSYDLGPWALTVSARRKFGDGDVRAKLSYAIRF